MKILFLAANPQSTSRLNLGQEAKEIQEALDISELSKEFELIQQWEVRPKDFRRALLKYKPDIVHFSGHGKSESGLVIADESGAAKPVTRDALAGLFAEFPGVKCVLLNACYAEVQAQAIVRHIDYVIGMRDTIYDKAAIAFSIGFYDGLGYGRTIEEAFNLGSNAILWEYEHNSGKMRDLIPVDSAQVKSPDNLPEHLKPILLKKADHVAPKVKNQPPTTESISISSNPSQKYRARIQKYLQDRNLTPIAKFQLATFAKEQGISESEANNILQAELAKIEQAKATYRDLLRQTIAQGFNLFDHQTQKDLQSLQQYLKLTDQEVAAILETVLAQTELDNDNANSGDGIGLDQVSETKLQSDIEDDVSIDVNLDFTETTEGISETVSNGAEGIETPEVDLPNVNLENNSDLNIVDRTTQARGEAALGGAAAAASGFFSRNQDTEHPVDAEFTSEQDTAINAPEVTSDLDLSDTTEGISGTVSDGVAEIETPELDLPNVNLDNNSDLNIVDRTTQAGRAAIVGGAAALGGAAAAASGFFNRNQDTEQSADAKFTSETTSTDVGNSLGEMTLEDAANMPEVSLDDINFDDVETNSTSNLSDESDVNASSQDITLEDLGFAANMPEVSLDDINLDDVEVNSTSNLSDESDVNASSQDITLDDLDFEENDMKNIYEWLDSLN